jgi:hypothetical protein
MISGSAIAGRRRTASSGRRKCIPDPAAQEKPAWVFAASGLEWPMASSRSTLANSGSAVSYSMRTSGMGIFPWQEVPPLLIANGHEGLEIDQEKIDQIIFDRSRYSR